MLAVWALHELAFENQPKFLFRLKVKLFTTAFWPSGRIPELIGPESDVWYLRHCAFRYPRSQLDVLLNYRTAKRFLDVGAGMIAIQQTQAVAGS
jgi:hypothetical protein